MTELATTSIAKASTKRTKAKAPNGQRKQVVTYTDEIGDLICQRLREGESLLSVCSSDDMPSESAVRQWAADPTHQFSAKYARAREVGWLRVGDEVLALADGLEHGKDRHDPNIIARDRLRYEARRWMLSKVLPKIYGDRLEVDAKAGLVVVETPAAIKALLTDTTEREAIRQRWLQGAPAAPPPPPAPPAPAQRPAPTPAPSAPAANPVEAQFAQQGMGQRALSERELLAIRAAMSQGRLDEAPTFNPLQAYPFRGNFDIPPAKRARESLTDQWLGYDPKNQVTRREIIEDIDRQLAERRRQRD